MIKIILEGTEGGFKKLQNIGLGELSDKLGFKILKIEGVNMERDWRKEMLNRLKTPLKYISGEICDAEDHLLASMYRERGAILFPVDRDELCKELVKRFNAYTGD